MKKTIGSIALLCSISVSSLYAADASLDKAEELLILSGTDTTLEQMTRQMVTAEIQKNPTLVPFENVLYTFFDKYIGFEDNKELYAQIYVETFTDDELQSLIDFYQTDVGKKLKEKSPEMVQKSFLISQTRVEENIGELQRMIQEEAVRLQQLQQSN